jgi:hypothetical protein
MIGFESGESMTRKSTLKMTLITGLVFLAFGGWLLHLMIHPPFSRDEYLIPFISGIFSIFVLPALFWYKPTLAYAYVINGFTVIIGTITMAHFSIAHFTGPVTVSGIFLHSMLADISILWGKFAVGKAIFDLELINTAQDPMPKGRYFRYPNTGWSLVHLVSLSVVYALGNIFWR